MSKPPFSDRKNIFEPGDFDLPSLKVLGYLFDPSYLVPDIIKQANAKLASLGISSVEDLARLRGDAERLADVERERDAYKKAKEENDERFMRERDEARERVRDFERQIAEAPVVYGCNLGADLLDMWTNLPHDEDSHSARLIQIEELK